MFKVNSLTVRGGSWFNLVVGAHCAYRGQSLPDVRYLNFGFRVVLTKKLTKKRVAHNFDGYYFEKLYMRELEQWDKWPKKEK